MVVRDLLNKSDPVRVIARTIFEDRTRPDEYDGWITKYYAQFVKLKESKIRKSDMMFCMHVIKEDCKKYTLPYGIKYKELKAGKAEGYAIEYLYPGKYSALYVPDYMVKTFGVEIVAAEALKEYGWNRYDSTIVCSEEIREQIKKMIPEMETGLFVIKDEETYDEKCKREFCKWYEGKY